MFGVPVTDHQRLPSMTVAEAHRVMQVHIDCLVSVCPIKQQAKARLVADRRMVPADRPHMGF
ncbi:hypothetical protein GV791_08920 [Nocardia cyriacigeorgica]|uniref:Uncharacterized protein n=1 Tax=Nocardia cyriacigeorgica TaxID=135487 RepID=A0A6P1CLZ5_9NOCA|nr:hypothetical protein [Nocardia cyriacigeorgica]MBF6080641.1 hypothetical protein [Nocardia cyriacigeorgica]MBF6423475.1 hypothetical protein [Nocardia cyriacigeorgica]NEW32683.1 hypothetical protein [Nocardia cyriacigeorgica]BDT87878.1 hypothetical protein FMUAM8_36420 [Nocardia cyriacigeorgica]